MSKNLKHKKAYILTLIIISIFGMYECSKENIKYTNFQKAYFDISERAKSNNVLTKEALEKFVGTKVSTYLSGPSDEDLNVYLFEVNDEKIRAYTPGLTVQYKTDSIDQQKMELDRQLSKK